MPQKPSTIELELTAARQRLTDLERRAQDRDRACAELAHQADFLRLVLESLHHPFYVIDAGDYTIDLANSAAGFGDLAGRPTCHELTHGRAEPCSGDEHACPLALVKATKRSVMLEHIHTDAGGQDRNIEVHAHPVFDGEGNVVRMIEYCLDVTERKRAEQQRSELEDRVRQSHKMEAIGILAGGVAHNMNNMLAAILGSASLLQRDEVPAHKRQRLVDRIVDAAERGTALTRNLLGFARRGTFRRQPVDLGATAAQVVELLEASTPEGIRFQTEIEAELPAIEGDADQLNQVVMNLCLNAIHATAGEGTVRVAARRRTVGDGGPPGTAQLPPGEYVELVVGDDGKGMTRDVLERAVEPFFTTKPPGQGTGLGLSMAFGTAQSHGGALWLTSQPGAGSVATALFPVMAAAGAGPAEPGGRR